MAFKSAIAWEILGEFAERYPEYITPDSDAEKNEFKILYRDSTGEEQGYALISSTSIGIASRASLSAIEWQECYRFFINSVLEKLTISPLSVVHLDNEMLPSWKTRAHHGRILYELFGEGTGLRQMFSGMGVYQFSSKGLFMLDRDEHVMCMLSFQSRGPTDVDRLEFYPEPYELSATCGVAKTGAFASKTPLADVVDRILTVSEEAFDSKFIPAVVDPISRLISQIERDLPADPEGEG
ncbi:MAG: hypothetical protein IID41_06715 [Planctomycetes bacterium]|nr:hypothetical protein [Planctomycetota bacterium]